jgi:hypothetical protein
MIRQSVLCGFLLLIAYSIVLKVMPDLSATPDQWQANITKAEEYIYSDNTTKNAIIGSSLSERLVMDRLPEFENLSLSGLSILDGLELLRHKARLPSYVYIETNVLLREKNDDFSATLFAPIPFVLRKHVIAFRADKQPLALIGQSLGERVKALGEKVKYEVEALAGRKSSRSGNVAAGAGLDDEMLNVQVKDYSERPDPQLLREQLKLLSDDVTYLRSRRVQVVFFEMPVNPKLTELPKAQAIRNGCYAAFPRDRYQYIDMPESAGYMTTDGIHLNRREAVEYTRYFLEQTKKVDNR